MKKPFSISVPLMISIISLGPIGWSIIDILDKKAERLLLLFIISIVLVVIDTIFWCKYFSKDNSFNEDDDN